jgi:hypothetical protein
VAGACDTTAAGRLPLLMLGPLATAYEQAMTEGEGKNTWRLDRYSPCSRQEAGRYLAFLGSVGYELSGIEQAVADGVAWAGDTEPSDPLSPASGDPASPAGQPSSATEDTGEADPPATTSQGMPILAPRTATPATVPAVPGRWRPEPARQLGPPVSALTAQPARPTPEGSGRVAFPGRRADT